MASAQLKMNALVTSLPLWCDVMSLSASCVQRMVWCLAGVLGVECGQWTISCSLFWSKLRPCFIQTSKLLHSYWPVVNQLCMVKMLEHLKGCHEECIACQPWHTCTSVPLAATDATFLPQLSQYHFRLAWHTFRSHLTFSPIFLYQIIFMVKSYS